MTLDNKVWLLVGGSGTLGNQLTKDILKLNPKKIIIYSRSDKRQHDMDVSFDYNKNITYRLGDVLDYDLLNYNMYGVDFCINMSAVKRIEKAEENPDFTFKTNAEGTKNCIRAALENNIECLLFTSTDKAKNPCGIYGQSKALAETYMTNAHCDRKDQKTKFVVTRYGNVWKSSGSVGCIWENRHKLSLPIIVRGKETTRFFMTIKDASELVLNTIEHGEGDQIHSLPMKAVNMSKLAKYLYPNDKITIEPLHKEEKLHEILYDGYNSKDACVEPKDHPIWKK